MNLEDVLDDLCARFIINLPEEERSSFERLGFQVEQAFWFYDDFYRPTYPHLPRLTLRSFGQVLLQRYPPLIAPFGRNFDKLYEEFMAYKHAIPVCGAIILNETLTKCLLVKGWYSRSSWGFPKGKIGKDEDPSDCAVREVYEETGFDISSKLSSNNYIDAHTTTNSGNSTNQQSTRLFIIPSVPESTLFIPQTRKEISKIQWYPIEDLPTKFGQDNSFYNVVNFVKKLKQWIKTGGQEYKNEMIGRKKKAKASSSSTTTSKQPGGKTIKQISNTKQSGNKFKSNSNVEDAAAASQDIFDKLRLKDDNSPVNSVLMRDNPSPIHLFEKLSITTTNVHVSTTTTTKIIASKQDKFLQAIGVFADSLKNLKINRSVIRESINKCY